MDYGMTEIVKMASEVAAKTAIDVFDKQRNKAVSEWNDRRKNNTKLLLRNYRLLKDHIDSAVYEQDKVEFLNESAQDILEFMWSSSDGEAVVESIKKSVHRTKTIMEHVKTMLRTYEIFCETSSREEDHRRWRVINAMYISDVQMSPDEIAEAENIDKRTVYRDVSAAVENISALIFGLNGLKIE